MPEMTHDWINKKYSILFFYSILYINFNWKLKVDHKEEVDKSTLQQSGTKRSSYAGELCFDLRFTQEKKY